MAPNKLMNYVFIAAAALLLVGALESRQAEARNFAGVNPFCRTTSHRLRLALVDLLGGMCTPKFNIFIY